MAANYHWVVSILDPTSVHSTRLENVYGSLRSIQLLLAPRTDDLTPSVLRIGKDGTEGNAIIPNHVLQSCVFLIEKQSRQKTDSKGEKNGQ